MSLFHRFLFSFPGNFSRIWKEAFRYSLRNCWIIQVSYVWKMLDCFFTHSKVRGVYFIAHVCVSIGPCVWVLSEWHLLNQSTCLWPNLVWQSIIMSQNMVCKNLFIFKVKCVLFYWLCRWNCTQKRKINCQTNSTWVKHSFSCFYCQACSDWNILSAAFTVRPVLPG